MKRAVVSSTLTFLIIFLFQPIIFSQDIPDFSGKPLDTLTHELSPWEAELMRLNGRSFYSTPPPTGPVRNVAEFERMQGVLIRYPLGIPYALIAEISQDITVTTIVTGPSQENTVRNYYSNNGVNLANCNFLHAPTDSYWTRDYGPWFVFDGNDDPGIVNFPYNRPRPDDDDIPIEVASFLGIDLYGMDIEHTGGNYMTEGMGISSSTDLVWDENPGLSHAQIDQMVLDYLGVHTYHVVADPNNTYIDHIDCWGKFLDVDKVLIREVPTSHAQYDEIEATAAYYAAQTTSYGIPFQVFRVYTPNDEPYTNSLILNEKVLVPITGSQWDDEALQAYQDAMPGYEVLGFTGSWQSTDALHCRTKGMADIGMLHIHHIPWLGNAPILPEYTVDASITAHSGQTIYSDSLLIWYSVNDGPFAHTTMSHVSGKDYTGIIPGGPEGTKISYYLYAADASGRRETHPFIGEPDPHIFYVGQPLFPDIAVSPQEINASCPAGGSDIRILTIDNQGQFLLNHQISCSTDITEDLSYSIPDSPSRYSWDYNTYTELGWTDFTVGDAGQIANWQITYEWYTDNWPYEGSFHVQSPSGTSAIIASGSGNGTYSFSLDAFNGEEMQGDWKLWIEDTYGDGGHQASNITVTITRIVSMPSWLSVNPASGTIDPANHQDIQVICDASQLTEGTYEGALTITCNDPDTPETIVPVYFNVTSGYYLDLKLYLEGPFGTAQMWNYLNIYGYLPLIQPYSGSPWFYPGTESVAAIPGPDVIDWILLEYRDAPDAPSATQATAIGRQAAFLMANGEVKGMDATQLPVFNYTVNNQLYVVVIHRNHLDIMSANPLILNGNIYTYDFSISAEQAYGGTTAQKEIAAGVFGMPGADGDADGQVTNGDKNDVWSTQAGTTGYLEGDYNLDSNVNNGDKNDVWIANGGMGSQVPE